jgi:hypothetical protein
MIIDAAGGHAPQQQEDRGPTAIVCHRNLKIGGLGNFGAPRMPPRTPSVIRSSVSAAWSSVSGPIASPGRAAEAATKVSRRAATLRPIASCWEWKASATPCSTCRNEGRPQRGSGGK